jgi:hypothetical protein
MGAAQMAQPISTIAEAACEAQAKLRVASLQSTIATDASPTGPRGEAIESIPTRPQGRIDGAGINDDRINDPVLDAPRGGPQSSPLVPELSPIAPPTTPEIADVTAPPMAPGIGGFNIDAPAARASPVEDYVAIADMRGRSLLNLGLAVVPELSALAPPTAPAIPNVAGPAMARRASPVEGDVAIADMGGRLLFNPEIVRQSPIQTGRKAGSSFVFNLLAIVAIVGVMLLAFPDEAGKQLSDISRAVMPLHEGSSSAGPSAQPARLVIESQKGFANEPLPLGVSLKDASGGETIMVAGLAAGTELSLGTSLGLAGWLVSAGDLDKTFVGAPKDFVGVMDATVNLRSAGDQLLHSQVVRLEWIEKKEERLTPRLDPPKQAQVFQPLNPDEIATLIKVGEDFLKRGDIPSARVLFKRAAIAGNAQAALELAMTFDQVSLAQWGVLGFAADAAQAREWYDRAIKLGSTEAARHLARLASMPR